MSLFSLIEFSVDSDQFNNNVNAAKFISYVNKFKWISMNIQTFISVQELNMGLETY